MDFTEWSLKSPFFHYFYGDFSVLWSWVKMSPFSAGIALTDYYNMFQMSVLQVTHAKMEEHVET
jgi:IS1 family transposase